MLFEDPVIQISACCYLPGPHIQPPHHSALQPPQSASPAHHASFVYRDNNGEGHFFKLHTMQEVSCNLLSRIPTIVVHMLATKECRGVEV